MSLILSGSDGLSDVDGSASTPAIRGTDANTGIFFPAADTAAISTGGSERMRIDSSGNVTINNNTSYRVKDTAGNNIRALIMGTDNVVYSGCFDTPTSGGSYVLMANGSERARIPSGGGLLVGCTATPSASVKGVEITGDIASTFSKSATLSTGDIRHWAFYNPNGLVGGINTNGSGTAFSTTSDYRLKENVAPMTGALATVAQLKPCTYTWKVDGSAGQGFIAHELQEVCPNAVVGEKDAIDADGNPRYQGVDTSFLVATLTAAIQELKAELDAAKARIAVLEAK